MSKKKRSPQRTERLQPSIPALKPSSAPQELSALQIAADTIEKLEAENAALRSGVNSAPHPNVTIEHRIFDEWQKTLKAFGKSIRDVQRWKGRAKEFEKRNKLLNDRLLSMQYVADQKEKQ
jgi:hypothetical protein